MNALRALSGLSKRTLLTGTLAALVVSQNVAYAGDGPAPRQVPPTAPAVAATSPTSVALPKVATAAEHGAAAASAAKPATPGVTPTATAPAPSAPSPPGPSEPTASAPTQAQEPNPVAPHGDPHGMGQTKPLLNGSPFASADHRHQAELLRAGRSPIPQSQNMPGDGVPPGTLGMLVRDGERAAVVGAKVKLFITHESIGQGNTESVRETNTDAQGRAAFTGLSTDSSYKYEAVVEQGGARYSTGAMRLRRESGQIAVLYVFPTTDAIDDTFVITRMLYALQPREDIFQVDTILRIQNGGTKTWSPKDFYVELPSEFSAFRPPQAAGDLRAVVEGKRVHITGSFTPGQHELSFGFQLPNPRTPNIHLALATVPHLTDSRVFLEATENMGLQVEGLRPAERTTGQEGQNALMASSDFLGSGAEGPSVLRVNVTGMPPRGRGNIIASIIAGLIAMAGIAYAKTSANKGTANLTNEDRARAKALLLDELVALEKAYRGKEIGPKTYEQARRTLLDSIARLETT